MWSEEKKRKKLNIGNKIGRKIFKKIQWENAFEQGKERTWKKEKYKDKNWKKMEGEKMKKNVMQVLIWV